MTKEHQIEQKLIKKLIDFKYTYREDIRDKNSLETNFRNIFQELNRVNLSDAEFEQLKDEIIGADVFAPIMVDYDYIINLMSCYMQGTPDGVISGLSAYEE